ncbi:MAG: C40 family peptidase [Actinomycetota bacterium]
MTGSVTSSLVVKVAAATVAAVLGVALLPAPSEAHSLDGFINQRRHLKSRAKSQIGAPYRSGGSTPRGFDCSGFTRWVFKNHGSRLPHSSIEQFRLTRRRPHAKRIWKRRDLRIGDLVFHKTSPARVGHAGLYIGRGKFISSTSSEGVRVDSVWDRYYWGSRWVGATRLKITQR